MSRAVVMESNEGVPKLPVVAPNQQISSGHTMGEIWKILPFPEIADKLLEQQISLMGLRAVYTAFLIPMVCALQLRMGCSSDKDITH